MGISVITSFLFFCLLSGISSALMLDSIMTLNQTARSDVYNLKLIYKNLKQASSGRFSPIRHKYPKILELLSHTADYYEKEENTTTQNVKTFLNTTLDSVTEKCSNLIDPNAWEYVGRNYTAYSGAVKKLEEFLISPLDKNYTEIDGIKLATNLILNLGNFINSLKNCFDDQDRLNEEDVMRVMFLILREITKNIFLAGKINIDEENIENPKAGDCSKVFYPVRKNSLLFDALMVDIHLPFESCYDHEDIENCATDLLKNCGPELATTLKLAWCPSNSDGCKNFQ